LLGSFLGIAVSKNSMMTSYIFTFAILLAVMTNVCHFYYMRRPQKPDFWGCWGPFLLMCLATVCILTSPLKNLVVNVCMQSFRENGFDHTIETTLDLAYMPVFATKPLQAYTALAYVFMFWSTSMQVDIYGKMVASILKFKGTSKSEAGCEGGS